MATTTRETEVVASESGVALMRRRLPEAMTVLISVVVRKRSGASVGVHMPRIWWRRDGYSERGRADDSNDGKRYGGGELGGIVGSEILRRRP